MIREQIGRLANQKVGERKRKWRDKDTERGGQIRGRVMTITNSPVEKEKKLLKLGIRKIHG